MIQFNVPAVTGKEQRYIKDAITRRKLSGDGFFTKKCQAWLENKFGAKKALLTPSCTGALEMAALLSDVKPGDEIILPSYTFSSTANAFALRGAKLVFVDIRPDTMNTDEKLIERAVTKKTKAIVVMHYAGVGCEMDVIMKIARKYNLLVIEDAAQGVTATYKNKPLGIIGDIGCYSFHETKNYTCGEGGAILLNDKKFIERAEIIREKGTDRSKFYRGEVAKYSWLDLGSSYLPSELNAAFLYAQLEAAEKITKDRLKNWNLYYLKLKSLAEHGNIELPFVPKECRHNAHMFYIKTKNQTTAATLIEYLKKARIKAVSHYIPLHSSKAGKKFGIFHGKDNWTTKESGRLIRLPLYYKLAPSDVNKIADAIRLFYNRK